MAIDNVPSTIAALLKYVRRSSCIVWYADMHGNNQLLQTKYHLTQKNGYGWSSMKSWFLIEQAYLMQQLLPNNWLNVHTILKKGVNDIVIMFNQISLAQNFVVVKETVNEINDWVEIKLFFKIMVKYN